MADITDMIVRDVQDDISLKPHGFTVVLDPKKLFSRHRTIRVTGSVASQHELEQIHHIVDHHAGDTYQVVFEIKVNEPA